MKVYPYRSEGGLLVGFEVKVISISLSALESLILKYGKVESVFRSRGNLEGVHLMFKLDGTQMTVLEMFGDNSRYWIGPNKENSDVSAELEALMTMFELYAPPIWRRILTCG